MRKRKWLPIAAGLGLFLLWAGDSRLRTAEYVVRSEEVSGPVRLAVLTDLHSCAYGEAQAELLAAVDGLKPDAVLLGGDIVDDEMPEEPAWQAAAALAERYPCVYVIGNHEWWSGDAERMCRQMEELGVTVLRGGSITWELQGQQITVCGVDDPDSGEDQLTEAAKTIKENNFTVLLAHRPERIDDYLKFPFDLLVSGHAHGGQWRIPGILNGLYAPNQGLFPQYAGGRYDFEKSVFLVSRGLARESTRVPRFFNRPELVAVEIVPAESAG